jgi:hypothetical protein
MAMNRDKPQDRWPFDPMQPGDHEPARPAEEVERVQKQTGRGKTQPSPDYRKSEEKPK